MRGQSSISNGGPELFRFLSRFSSVCPHWIPRILAVPFVPGIVGSRRELLKSGGQLQDFDSVSSGRHAETELNQNLAKIMTAWP
jgi:hypothetical protein